MSRYCKYVTLSLLVYIGLISCANERAITGGPADQDPPQVIFSYPENETVNVDHSTEILIKFNEQMKKSTFNSALQIWPRPPGEYQVKASWTWLKITFSEPLDSNETYLLTLDKGAQDLRGNGLAATYVMAFSTGRDLNAGTLRGRINGPQDVRKNGDLLLYRRFDTNLAELRKEDAEYVFQPDDEGTFQLPYLAERSYMLFYHWDKNQNKQIDGDDYFGRPVVASVRARPDSLVTVHEIWPQVVPLAKVKLLEVSKIADQFMKIRTSRLVTEETLESAEVFLDGIKLPILGSTLVAEDEFAMHLDVAVPLSDSLKVFVRGFQDTSGYTLSSDTLLLVTPSVLDTLTLEPLQVSWVPGSETQSTTNSQIEVRSNLPLMFTSDSAFSLVNSAADSITLNGSLDRMGSMNWLFTPDSLLEDDQTYVWQVSTDQMFVPLNGYPLDSLLTGSLKTVAEDSLGSLKVLHMGSGVLECRLTGVGVERNFQMKSGQPVTLDGLPAQTYSLVAYIDENANGRYESGGLGPAASSEPFWFYKGEIRVRARWETDLGLWRFRD